MADLVEVHDSLFKKKNLTISHLPDIIRLRNHVLSTLDDPDHYIREAKEGEFIVSQLGASGFSVGIFYKEYLVAYASLESPGMSEENLGRFLGYEDNLLLQVGHLSACMVAPQYRNYSFHSQLIDARLKIAANVGLKYVMAMVSPKNIASLHNLLNNGFQVVDERLMSHGAWRFILHRAVSSIENSGHFFRESMKNVY